MKIDARMLLCINKVVSGILRVEEPEVSSIVVIHFKIHQDCLVCHLVHGFTSSGQD